MFGGFVGFTYLCRLMKLTDNLNIRKSIALLVLAATFAACSGDSTDTPANGYNDGPTNPSGEAEEIRVNADVFQMMDGTRTTTYDSPTALQTEGSFTCSAYKAGTTTGYFTGATVDWDNRISSNWAFTTAKYWPLPPTAGAAYPSLDFFAYMPASKPDYITDITYTTVGSPQFTCENLSGSASKEFICALTTGQNKNSNSGTVNLDFKHPFARLKFQLSASHPYITIYTITLKNLKTGGTCTFNGSTTSWSTASAATADFVADINQACSTSVSVQDLGTNYIVVPQTLDLEITVKAGWIDWGETIPHYVSTTLTDVTWAAGTSYTYIFTITESDLKVDTTKFTEQW